MASRVIKNQYFAALFFPMAETLGSLYDKLTIVKLKQYHSVDKDQLASLEKQAVQLRDEINEYMGAALSGFIPAEKLTFAANKIYKKETNRVDEVTGNMGEVMIQLADVNCRLWHEQEKLYDFEKVPVNEKDNVVKQVAAMNLERNKCIDRINVLFAEMVVKK